MRLNLFPVTSSEQVCEGVISVLLPMMGLLWALPGIQLRVTLWSSMSVRVRSLGGSGHAEGGDTNCECLTFIIPEYLSETHTHSYTPTTVMEPAALALSRTVLTSQVYCALSLGWTPITFKVPFLKMVYLQ